MSGLAYVWVGVGADVWFSLVGFCRAANCGLAWLVLAWLVFYVESVW